MEVLDESWIEELEMEKENYEDYYLSPTENIKVFCVYIDEKNNIHHVEKFKQKLFKNFLLKDELQYIIKEKRDLNNTRYSLISLMQFSIDLVPEDLSIFLKNEENYNFLKILPNIETIEWKDTIGVFKSLNSLYILFYNKKKKKSTAKTKKIIVTKLNKHKKTKKKT